MRIRSSGDKHIAPTGATLTAAVAFSLGAAACGDSESICTSPPKVSTEFAGDPNAIENDQSTWTEGIEIDTHVPKEAKSLEVGFTDPDGLWHVAEVDPDQAKKIGLTIGHIQVKFKTQIIAVDGSPLCHQMPDTHFIRKPAQQLGEDKVTFPDPNKFHIEQPSH